MFVVPRPSKATVDKAKATGSIDRKKSRRDRLRKLNSQLATTFPCSSTGQPQPRAGSPRRPNAPGAPGALEHGDFSDAQGLSPILSIPRPRSEDASIPVWANDGLSPPRQDRLGVPPQVDTLPLDSTSVNHRDVAGRTLLHLAASQGDRALVTRLLADGAPIDSRDIFGRTPLHAGIQHPAVVLELMKYNAALLQDANGNTPFHEVFLGTMPPRQRLQISNIFSFNHSDVNVQNHFGLTPFWAALRNVFFREDEFSWLKCIAGMLLSGADVKTLDACGVSPFEQFAKTTGIGSQSDWLSNPSVKQVALLFIECGASIWTRMARDEPLAEILLGPTLTFLDHDVVIQRMCLAAKFHATPDKPFLLHQVMLCGWNLRHTVDFAVLLLEDGADPNAMNLKGQTPMLLATETSNDPEFVEGVVMTLMEYGADPWFPGSGEQCPFFSIFCKWPRNSMIQRILSADTIDRENKYGGIHNTEAVETIHAHWPQWAHALMAKTFLQALRALENIDRSTPLPSDDDKPYAMARKVLAYRHLRMAEVRRTTHQLTAGKTILTILNILRECQERRIPIEDHYSLYLLTMLRM